MSSILLLLQLLVFGVVHITHTSQVRAATSPKCRIEFSRVVGPQNYYRLICKCGSFFEAKSVATAPAPPSKLDTNGRNDATIECIKSQQAKLTSACARLSESEFSKQMPDIITKCTKSKLTKEQAMDDGPIVYDSSTCLSKVGSSIYGDEADINWICECNQGGFYEVSPGWATYYLKGPNASLEKEIDFLRNCMTTDAGKKMSRLCTESPEEYYVQGLQSLETCCKRLRVNSDGKFECKKITPGKLGRLMKFKHENWICCSNILPQYSIVFETSFCNILLKCCMRHTHVRSHCDSWSNP